MLPTVSVNLLLNRFTSPPRTQNYTYVATRAIFFQTPTAPHSYAASENALGKTFSEMMQSMFLVII